MFGIRYLKAEPTTYVMQHKAGRLVAEGAGLSFYYFSLTSTIVLVPLASADLPFIFEETTADFQVVTVQGQLTYRIADPKRTAELLNFAVGGAGRYISDDPEKLKNRLTRALQELARAEIKSMALKATLTAHARIVAALKETLPKSPTLAALGIEVLDLTLFQIAPTPDMARALEAEARERLQREADQAVFDRRNAAVEQERRIKESELNTEIAVEQKRRQIRENQIAADIAVEQQRADLIKQVAENERQAADTRAYALEATLKPIRATEWRTLMAMQAQHVDSRSAIAMAFREIAENAGKIGELNISSELLGELLKKEAKK